MKRNVEILTETVNLDAFLKWAGVVMTGGEAKLKIQNGEVKVNGSIETRRSRRLSAGDVVTVDGTDLIVVRK